MELVKAALEEATIHGGVGSDKTTGGTSVTGNTATVVDALEQLLEHDQLTRERMLGRAFSGFSEGVTYTTPPPSPLLPHTPSSYHNTLITSSMTPDINPLNDTPLQTSTHLHTLLLLPL